jgi:hypothetical protein
MEQDGTDGTKSEIGWDIQQLPGGPRSGKKKNVNICTYHHHICLRYK